MGQLTRTAPCRGCGKEIAFIKTVKGKTMPVNPESVEFIPGEGPGTYVMADGTVQHGRPVREDDHQAVSVGFVSHFATCPEAGRFRKR